MQSSIVHVGENLSITRPLAPGELQLLSTSELFHRLWTRAVGQQGYDKAIWWAFGRAPTRTGLAGLRNAARGQKDFSEEEWAELFSRSLGGVAL